MRKNQGKPRLSLIFLFPNAIRAVIGVITKEGAEKYGPPEDRGWMSYDPGETLDSLTRHLDSVMNGHPEDIDNVIFNAMVYRELMTTKVDMTRSRESIDGVMSDCSYEDLRERQLREDSNGS